MSSSDNHTDISQETVENSNTESSIVIKENTNGFQQLFIEIAAGEDIVSSLVNFAQTRQVAGIVVLGGSGDISDVTLYHPESCTPFSSDQGSFHMTRLSGTHINVNDDCIPPHFMDTYGGPSSFSILFQDNNGQNFGGIVNGAIMTAGVVSVQAYLLRKPKFRRLGINGIAEGIEEDDDSIYGDDDEEDGDDEEGDSDDEDDDDDDDEEGDSDDDDDDFINAVHGLVALKSA